MVRDIGTNSVVHASPDWVASMGCGNIVLYCVKLALPSYVKLHPHIDRDSAILGFIVT